MMKMKRTVLKLTALFLLTAALLLCFAGCNGDIDPNGKDVTK